MFSCNKILNTQPQDFSTPEQYYNSESQLNDALAGVYTTLSNKYLFQNVYPTLLNTGNDESYYRSTTIIGAPVYTQDASTIEISGLWQALYQGIRNANALLENIKKPAMDSTKRNVIKGEALFLRSYYYFLLVQHWGDVPLLLTSTKSPESIEYSVSRTLSKDIYTQIITDMTTAEGLVSDITTLGYGGRVSKSAVRGMLARVCLFNAGQPVNDVSKYADALIWAKKVYDSKLHSLNPDYSQIFVNYIQDKYDIKESIFESEFYGNATASTGGDTRTPGYTGIQVGVQCSNLDSGYCYGNLMAQGLLYKAYEATDKRRDWTIGNYTYSGVNKVNMVTSQYYGRFPAKFRRELELLKPKAKNANGTNFPILRYADVLLMLAEAENEMNGPLNALQYLNMVRSRAGATVYLTSNSDVNSQISFRKTVQDERYRELAFECLRNMDLVRWGLLITNTKAAGVDLTANAPSNQKYGANASNNITSRDLLWPVPIYDLSLNNKLTQNPGY